MNGWASKLKWLCLGLLAAPALQAQDFSLEELFSRIAVQPPASVAFTEERHSAMLQQPLAVSGLLQYLGPGHLVKNIQHPFQETLVVTPEGVEISRAGEIQRHSLRSNRLLKTLFGGIEALLAGDAALLQQLFQPDLSGDAAEWQLQLQPRNQRIAAHLQQIVVSGNGELVKAIRIQFDEQEWQLMELRHDLPGMQ